MKSLLLALLALPVLVAAQMQPKPTPFSDPSWVRTSHSMHAGGRTIKYTATAGYMPIKSDDGKTEAQIFFVAYTADGADKKTRPVTFAFNGGPGSASLWLHMGALGPKRAKLKDDGSMPALPFEFVDNDETWLRATDVVMIDAPGTGYSRVTDPNNKRFFGVRGDIQAFTEICRMYLTTENRWSSPVYIAGESYGGIRGAGLTYALHDAGMPIAGFINISGVLDYICLDSRRNVDIPYMSFLPSMTATAFYHKKLPADLMQDKAKTIEECINFIDKEYAPALALGDALPAADRASIIKKLARFTGLSETFISRSNMRVREFNFFAELLRSEGKTTGRFDARLTGTNENGNAGSHEFDPSDTEITGPFMSAITNYFANELKFQTDVKYKMSGNVHPWIEGDGQIPETCSDLRSALVQNKYLRVLNCYGYYDLACPFFGAEYCYRHMNLPEEARKRIKFAFFEAGHMMYIEKSSREKLIQQVEAFISGK